MKLCADRIKEHLETKRHKKDPTPTTPKPITNDLNTAEAAGSNGEIAKVEKPAAARKILEPELVSNVEGSARKLSKRANSFLKGYNLENFAKKLVEEGESVKASKRHAMICTQIANALQNISPAVKVYPFGSRLTGLGGTNSDLDLFVDMSKCIQRFAASQIKIYFSF